MIYSIDIDSNISFIAGVVVRTTATFPWRLLASNRCLTHHHLQSPPSPSSSPFNPHLSFIDCSFHIPNSVTL